MNAAQGTLLGAGEATEMRQDASEAMATRQGAHGEVQAQIRALIGLGILEAVEACTRASEMVERLDGAYIHDDAWDEEQFVIDSWLIAGDSDEGWVAPR